MIKTKKQSSSILLAILSVLLFLGSIFAVKSIKASNNQLLHADTTTTNFYGSNVYLPSTPEYYGYNTHWQSASFGNYSDFYGRYVFDVNGTYYYSYGGSNKVLDISTLSWLQMTWNGLTTFSGQYIWNIGNTYYFSNSNQQYVLDISTNTWSPMTWNGFSNIYGQHVWSIGDTYYYSNGNSQYVLNSSTNTWSQMSWYGANVTGLNVWHIGDVYYFSSGSNQYVLNVSTNTWVRVTWNGLTSFNGEFVWHIDNVYYYSTYKQQYVLDISTNTWSPMFWSFPYLYGNNIWSIGNTYYYSNDIYQLYLEPGQVRNRTGITAFDSIYFSFIDNGNGTFNVKQNSLFYNNFDNLSSYSLSDKFCPFNVDISQDNSSQYFDYVVIDSQTGGGGYYYIPYQYNGRTYYSTINISCQGLSSVDFVKVDFDSTKQELPNNDYIQIFNVLTYTNSLNEKIEFSFYYRANSTYTLDYFGDTNSVVYDLFDNIGNESVDSYMFMLKHRTYYLNNDYLNSQTYQQGYSVGYNRGKYAGYDEGYSAGADAVSESQYNAGYGAGYSAGVVNSNNYSFLGLISAVIDAPIKYLTSLFNFDLLGFNMLNFLTGLFTLAVIITIVKKVI